MKNKYIYIVLFCLVAYVTYKKLSLTPEMEIKKILFSIEKLTEKNSFPKAPLEQLGFANDLIQFADKLVVVQHKSPQETIAIITNRNELKSAIVLALRFASSAQITYEEIEIELLNDTSAEVHALVEYDIVLRDKRHFNGVVPILIKMKKEEDWVILFAENLEVFE